MLICRPSREVSGETHRADSILDVQPPEVGAYTFVLCDPPSLQDVTVAAGAKSMTYGGTQGQRISQLKCQQQSSKANSTMAF